MANEPGDGLEGGGQTRTIRRRVLPTWVTVTSVIEKGGRAFGSICIAAAILLGLWLGRSWWPTVGGWLAQWWLLVVAVALFAIGAGVLALRRRIVVQDSASAERVPLPLSTRTIAVYSVLVVVVGTVAVVVLLRVYGHGTARDQLDAIKTAGTIVVGTGGVAALLLAARRQRSTELTLAHQHEVARSADADATERRITELYTKAVEQLGSDKAPVRLGGLYALERLAQDHDEQRQTIVNVLCAYLRMPYALPGDPPSDDADDKLVTAYRKRTQEREVRLAAQRILAHHMRPGADPTRPVPSFWTDIDLDLTGATLIDIDLTGCQIRTAILTRAHVTGDARFTRVTFIQDAVFEQITFNGIVRFDQVTFTRGVWFDRVTFTHSAVFSGANFIGSARFTRATFTGTAWFDHVTFTRGVGFYNATFTYNANFSGANFIDIVDFGRATLPSTRYASPNTPSPWADFASARFERGVPLEVAQFVSPPDEARPADEPSKR